MRLFHSTLWQKTTLIRRTAFRVVEQTPTRIVLRTRNYGILAGGSVFVAAGLGIMWIGFARARHETGTLVATLAFGGLFALVGLVFVWVSRTQRDTITVDRERGTIRAERALKRRRASDPPFRVDVRSLAELRAVEIRSGSGLASLRFRFRKSPDLDVDYATDTKQLRALGEPLAATAGVELEER
jgi:hypothetical protein